MILVLFFLLSFTILITFIFFIIVVSIILNKRYLIVDYDNNNLNYRLLEYDLLEEVSEEYELEYVDITFKSFCLFLLMQADKESFFVNFDKYFKKNYKEIVF